MLSLQVHIVTLKLIQANNGDLDHYFQAHNLDTNMWRAWLELSDLSHDKKLRKVFNVLPQSPVVECASQFAEQVLDIFEKEYPKNKVPRLAIQAARDWINNPCDYTRDAAAYTANAAAYAAYAAYAANAANAAYAANAAAKAANTTSFEKDQIEIILSVIKKMEYLIPRTRFT